MSKTQLFKIAVSAFIVCEEKILILKRAEDESFLPGTWEVPGGGIEEGETLEEGVIRETKEEAGLDVVPQQLFGYFEYLDGRGQKTVNLNFLCQLVHDTQDVDIPLGEMTEARWAPVDAFSEIPFTSTLMSNACREAIALHIRTKNRS